MRYHLAFLAGLTALIGAFAYLIVTFNENGLFYFQADRTELGQALADFQRTHHAKVFVNFSSLYGKRGQLQVLHPILDMRQLSIETARHVCNGDSEQEFPVVGSAASCHHASNNGVEDSLAGSRRKTEILARFLYDGVSLPESFLTKAPFLDNFGNSYAYLLLKKGPSPYNTREWIKAHLSYLKISELKEVLSAFQIEDVVYSLIATLSSSEIELAVRGEPLILTPDYMLIRDQSTYGFSPLSYWVYELRTFEDAVKEGHYAIGLASSETHCLQKMGNACWTYNSRYAFSFLYQYSVVVLILLGAIFGIVMLLYLRRLYEKNKEQQKHRLSLQVLSHEFRTPVSSLILMIENLRNSQNIDSNSQDLIARMSMEIFRLQRVVEVSKTYLQAEGGRIQFREVEIASVNQWISDFVLEREQNIQVQLLNNDQRIVADPFWLKFILSNLVQNAFNHGAEPVSLRVAYDKGTVQFIVQDQGVCEYSSLNEMTEAFVKSQSSKGMGLGLNIVKFIVEEWGGSIRFSNAPTSFTLSFNQIGIKAN